MRELSKADLQRCMEEARREVGLASKPPEGWVEMYHPLTRGYAYVTEEAYEKVWRKNGWLIEVHGE